MFNLGLVYRSNINKLLLIKCTFTITIKSTLMTGHLQFLNSNTKVQFPFPARCEIIYQPDFRSIFPFASLPPITDVQQFKRQTLPSEKPSHRQGSWGYYQCCCQCIFTTTELCCQKDFKKQSKWFLKNRVNNESWPM